MVSRQRRATSHFHLDNEAPFLANNTSSLLRGSPFPPEQRFARGLQLGRGKAETLIVRVDLEDASRDAGAGRPRLLVRETCEALGLDERAKRHLMRHHALDDVTDLVPREEILPAHEDHLLPVTSGFSLLATRRAGWWLPGCSGRHRP